MMTPVSIYRSFRPRLSASWLGIFAIVLADAAIMHHYGAALDIAGTVKAIAILLVIPAYYGLCLGLRRCGVTVSPPVISGIRDLTDIWMRYACVALALKCFQFGAILHARADPYLDDMLIRADAALGYSWTGFNDYVLHHAFLDWLLYSCYTAGIVEGCFLFVLFVFLRRRHANLTYFWGLTLSALVCCVVASQMPSLGFLNTQGDIYYDSMRQLRGGIWTVFDPTWNIALIAFPSYHSATATVMAVMACRTRWTGFILVPYNLAILVATGPIGGHHLADTLAGIAIGLLVMPLSTWLAGLEAPREVAPKSTQAGAFWGTM